MRLAGRRALITGGARGIGRAFAEAYLREGATVAIGDIDIARAAATAAEIGATALHLDVTDPASIEAAMAAMREAGGIDILINNAAIFTAAPIVEIARADYDRTFAINVAGTLFTMQAAARLMIDQGRGGRIINMASQAGRRGEALVAVYCATKAAVISLTQSAGLDLIRHGINVNAIAPGLIRTELTERAFGSEEALQRRARDKTPIGRVGLPQDLVGGVVYLCSDDAAFVTGHTLVIDGGWLTQ